MNVPELSKVPLLITLPELTNVIPVAIITSSPELTVKDDTVQVSTPFHAPDIGDDSQDD